MVFSQGKDIQEHDLDSDFCYNQLIIVLLCLWLVTHFLVSFVNHRVKLGFSDLFCDFGAGSEPSTPILGNGQVITLTTVSRQPQFHLN